MNSTKQYPDNLCDFCPLEKKGNYGVDGGYMAGCEGSKCDIARENYDIENEEIKASAKQLIETYQIFSINSFFLAKKCALIAVELHIKEISKMKLIFSDRELHLKKWQKVKYELEILRLE